MSTIWKAWRSLPDARSKTSEEGHGADTGLAVGNTFVMTSAYPTPRGTPRGTVAFEKAHHGGAQSEGGGGATAAAAAAGLNPGASSGAGAVALATSPRRTSVRIHVCSLRETPSERLISDPKVNQPKQARRPRMRIQRAHDRALAMAMAPPWPTGRGRMPEGPRSAMARAHGVFSEMPSRHRALGDGGAGLVHGPAWVRSLTVCV